MRLHFLNSAVIANSKMGYTDTLLLRTVFLVPGGEESSNIFSKFNPFNTDTCYGPSINEV